MPRLLETLQNGTPVFTEDDGKVGEVRGVFASGEGRGAELLLVFWTARGCEALVGAEEVMRLDENGVMLLSSLAVYDDLPAYEPGRNPLLHRL
jgi:hypothetical protein